MTMYRAFRSKDCPDSSEWRVERIHHEGDGECETAIFIGQFAEIEAKAYADGKNDKWKKIVLMFNGTHQDVSQLHNIAIWLDIDLQFGVPKHRWFRTMSPVCAIGDSDALKNFSDICDLLDCVVSYSEVV